MYSDGWAEVNDKEQEGGKKDVGVVRSCECNTAIDNESVTRRKEDETEDGRRRIKAMWKGVASHSP
jgi:hypothetical protein